MSQSEPEKPRPLKLRLHFGICCMCRKRLSCLSGNGRETQTVLCQCGYLAELPRTMAGSLETK